MLLLPRPAALLALCAIASVGSCRHRSAPHRRMVPARPPPAAPATVTQQVYFATGCFWRGRAAFQSTRGVVDVRVGYMSAVGEAAARSAGCVLKGDVEAVEVSYSPRKVGYAELLAKFWASHDHSPATADLAVPSYASALFVPARYAAVAAQAVAQKSVTAVCPESSFRFTPAVAPQLRCRSNYLALPGKDEALVAAGTSDEVPAEEADDFRRMVQKGLRAEGRILVLLFATHSFRGLFVNWVIHARRSGVRPEQYALVCLDDELGPWLRERGHWGCDFNLAGGSWERGQRKTKFMPTVRRLPLVRSLLRAGVHVLMSDLDAMFRKGKNPVRLLRSFSPAADVVFSSGSWPKKALNAWSGTPCMGFALWRSTPHSARILKAMTEVPASAIAVFGTVEAERTMSDQLRASALLMAEGLSVHRDSANGTAAGSRSGATREGAQITFLSQTTVTRSCKEMLARGVPDETYVLHCAVGPRGDVAKVREAAYRAARGETLLLMRPGWAQDAPVGTSWDSFVYNVTEPSLRQLEASEAGAAPR